MTRTFTWAALQKKVLAAERFRKMGFKGPSRCVLCRSSKENVNHLFLGCLFVQESMPLLKARLEECSSKRYSEFNKASDFSCQWIICLSILMWEIWKERDRSNFQDKALNINSFLNKVEASMVETATSRVRNQISRQASFGAWDASMKSNWFGLRNPPIVGPGGSYTISLREEQGPQAEWVKLNCNGASKGNPCKSGAVCLIRDWEGTIISRLSLPLPKGINNIAEFRVLILGLRKCRELKFPLVEVEGDSAIIIN
ncbi:hypothetical protein SUGI_0764880 [Cryptomeria japonica]|nr:hypothetical protein SUGI_0764880 [Cryptomeria japonica]